MQVNFEYEKECSHCDGTGNDGPRRYLESDNPDPCTWCNGAGTTLTEEGKKLAVFLTKYFDIHAPLTMKNHCDRKVPNPLYEGV